jgi:uncharacterized protein YjbI with pentapeptide repeats
MRRLWLWGRIKTHPAVTILVILVIALVVLVILGGYLFHWDWAGFNGKIKSGKTLWDWMQLLFIPVVLAVAGFWFNHRERKEAELRSENERKAAELRAKTESDIAEDNQREAALKEYIDKMSELLLHEKLRESKPEDEVRTIARVLTLTVVRRCDAERKGSVLLFLHESRLIEKGNCIIDLTGADLSEASLGGVNLSHADLSGAKLYDATLNEANLSHANLYYAELSNADMSDAYLIGANLTYANLSDANLTRANLTHANISDALQPHLLRETRP